MLPKAPRLPRAHRSLWGGGVGSYPAPAEVGAMSKHLRVEFGTLRARGRTLCPVGPRVPSDARTDLHT